MATEIAALHRIHEKLRACVAGTQSDLAWADDVTPQTLDHLADELQATAHALELYATLKRNTAWQ